MSHTSDIMHCMATRSISSTAFSSVGELLKHLRVLSERKQTELEKLYGIDQSTLSRVENDKANPTTEFLRKLATAYSIDFDNLSGTIASINQKAATSADELRLGMLHGIAVAPLIAAAMAGELHNIRIASTRDEKKLHWWVPPGDENQNKDSKARALFAGSLEKLIDDEDLDLIVASAAMFEMQTKAGGSLLRCAQISNSDSMIHLLEFRRKDPEIKSILEKSLAEPTKTQPANTKPTKLFFPEGSVGILYRDVLIDEGALKLEPQYYILDQPHNQLPEPIEEAFKKENHFLVLSWPPRSSSLKKIVKMKNETIEEKNKNWDVAPVNIGRLLSHYPSRVPVCSVDLLLKLRSARIVKWLQSGEYAKFFRALIRSTEKFSAKNLRQDSQVVDQVSGYLGIDTMAECYQELLLIDYRVLFYPEFLEFLDDVRNKGTL